MNRVKIVVAYDGSGYHGWQIQKNAESVMGAMVGRFEEIFGEKIGVLGASRTDAGVHAMGQVAAFSHNVDVDLSELIRAWNGRLIHDGILVRTAALVSPDYSPIRGVAYKIYQYHLTTRLPLPFVRSYVLYCPMEIDLLRFRDMLVPFVGTHDFVNFCKELPVNGKTVRTIDSIEVYKLRRYGVIRVVVAGKSFLHAMIRRILGFALCASSDKSMTPELVAEILARSGDEGLGYRYETLPGRGLLLRRIVYEK